MNIRQVYIEWALDKESPWRLWLATRFIAVGALIMGTTVRVH